MYARRNKKQPDIQRSSQSSKNNNKSKKNMLQFMHASQKAKTRLVESDSATSRIPLVRFDSVNEILNQTEFQEREREKSFEVFKKVVGERVKSFMPAIALLCLILIAAKILLEVEHGYGVPTADYFAGNLNYCIAANDYWTTITYVNGLTLAVGINGITTCTAPGKVISVICTIAGIPLSLIVLNQIGSWTCSQVRLCLYLANKLGKKLRRCCKRSHRDADLFLPEAVDDVPNGNGDDDLLDVPLSLGIAIPITWMLICAAVYAHSVHWPYGEASYFSFMLLTVGVISDITVFSRPLSAFSMLAIFLGLAFISNMINIIQCNIENLIKRVERQIDVELKQALNDDTFDTDEGVDEKIQRILKDLDAPPWIISMIPQSQMEAQVEHCQKNAEIVNQAIQASVESADSGIQYDFLMVDNAQQAQVTGRARACQAQVDILDFGTQVDLKGPPEAPAPPLIDTGTQTLPSQRHIANKIAVVCINGAQCADFGLQTILESVDASTFCFIKPEALSRCQQFSPALRDAGNGDSKVVEMVDFECCAKPSVRTVMIQHPKKNR